MKRVLTTGIGLILISLCSLCARQSNDSIRALFIGNSYTFFNKLPWMVQAIAHSHGKPMAVKMIAHGGWTLKQHAASPETIDAIREGHWDYVILQEQSQAPARDKDWVLENVYPYAQTLDSLRKAFNPQGKTVFYMTWGHRIDTYEEMQQRLSVTYLDMANKCGALCAPVGIAWKRVLGERPDMPLHDPDNSHPNLHGSYLAANVFYATMFGEDCQSDYTAGLPGEDAGYLQRIAREVVLSNQVLWNILQSPQPDEVTNRFFPNPAKLYDSPTLRKHFTEGISSNEEITDYLQRLVSEHPGKASIVSIGRTNEGRDISVIYFGLGDDKDKLKIWIQAGLHGNEPAGPEAACILADYLLNNETGRQLLTRLNIAILPVANPDGYAVQQRASASGLDLNRDQTKLADPVSVLLKKAFTEWNPDAALDIHEYRPWRNEYKTFTGNTTGIYEDVLFLPTGHLNVHPGVRELSHDLLQQNAGDALIRNGYNWGYYFTPTMRGNQMRLSKGARSPQSSSTNYALSNALSMFIEIRGIGLGTTSFARRAEAGFIVASSMLETCYGHKEEIKKALNDAISETIKGKNKVNVSFKSKDISYTARFVDSLRVDTFSATLPATDATQCESVLIRKRPQAYILPDTCANAVRILQALGVEVERTTKPLSLDVEQYVITEYEESSIRWENIYPVKVKARTEKIRKKAFPAGCYKVPLNQKNANYAVTLLEPEATNGFVAFRVLNVNSDQGVPVYRVR